MKFSKRRASFPPALKRGGGLHPKSPRPGSGMSLRHPSPPPASSFPRLLFLKSTKLHRPRPRISLAIGSSADSAGLSSTVGSPPPIELSQWSLGPRHIRVLNVAACVVAISTTWLFFSAIPSLLAFKRAAESMEKLLDVTAEELPDTMAAVRLSGMEISELTVELSDIGQEITQGVRRSTRTVRVAEDRLRQFATMAPTVPMQVQVPPRDETEDPALARTARNLREGILKGRALLGVIFGVTQFSRWAMNFIGTRQQKRSL